MPWTRSNKTKPIYLGVRILTRSQPALTLFSPLSPKSPKFSPISPIPTLTQKLMPVYFQGALIIGRAQYVA